jgi:hypothetical protein
MARPSFKATQDQRKLVHSLSAIGLPQEQIAITVGIRSAKTLRKHFGKDIAKGTAEAIATIAGVALKMAKSGKYPRMTRFWLSTVGGGMELPSEGSELGDSGRNQGEEITDGED